MKALARAVLAAMTFFECCDDEVLRAETAIQQMEQISLYLLQSSEAEKQALREVLQELAQELKSGSPAMTRQRQAKLLSFYKDFMDCAGLEAEELEADESG